MATAGDVTLGGAAEQSHPGGAAVAVATSKSQTQSGESVVIEGIDDGETGNEDSDDEESTSPTKRHANAPRFSLQAAMLEQRLAPAHEMIQREAARREARKDGTTSQGSIEDYKGRCRTIDGIVERLRDVDNDDAEKVSVDREDAFETAEPPEFSLLERAIAVYVHVTATFEKMRSALKWRALNRLHRLLQIERTVLEAKDLEPEARELWLKAIEDSVARVQAIEGLKRSKLLSLSKRAKKRSESKKRMLKFLPVDWRDAFLAENDKSPMYRIPGLLMRHLGLRPTELQRGVVVRLEGQNVRATILGSKVRETAGQPLRSVMLDASLMPAEFIDNLRTREQWISAKGDAMRMHLKRVSDKLYGKRSTRSKRLLVSAYCFRHAKVTDLYLEGWSSGEIAEVMGECVEETVAWYGDRPRRSKRPLQPQIVMRGLTEVARPVRSRPTQWLQSKKAEARRGASKPR